MRRTIALVSVLGLLFALTPLSGAGLIAAAPPVVGPRIGLVTDGGALGDLAFNQYAWAGVKDAAKAVHGSAEAIVPPANEPAYAWSIDRFAAHDFDVIVTVGFQMMQATLAGAARHPTIQFIGIDQGLDPGAIPTPNYQRLLFAEAQAGYLAGIVAATTSKTGVVGAVGGWDSIPPVLNFINGYRNGAASVAPGIIVKVDYAGDFSRPDLGADAAHRLLALGADVIFAVAGGSNLGVYGETCDDGLWAIGVDVDSALQAPAFKDCIVTSAEKRISTATALAIRRFAADGLQGGEFFNDASNGGVGLSPLPRGKTPKGLDATLKQALAGLAAGSINPCAPTACDTK